MNRKNFVAIILASGTGSRFGTDIPKQFCKIAGKTVLEYSIEVFENHKKIDSIIVVSNPDFIECTREIVNKNNYKKIASILSGGATRQESSYIGISAVREENSNVLIHDAVRPFVDCKIVDECISALSTFKAVNVAIESSDTIVEVDENNIIKNVPNRKYLRRCQTPQCFDLQLIKNAHELAKNEKSFAPTDDCGLVMRYGLTDIYVIHGSEKNIKITYPIDIKFAEEILGLNKEEV